MPRRGALSILITVAALVLVLSFRTPANALPGLASGRNGAANAPAANGAATSVSSNAPAAASSTINGQSVDTPFGAVQVAVEMQSGKIANVQILAYPSNHSRSVEISQYALPILIQETLQAQSANIDTVSGATYTSDAYAQSLQSALDQAH